MSSDGKTTAELLAEIAKVIDRPARKLSRGGTEPKAVLTDIVYALDLDVDWELPKPRLAARIAELGGQRWTSKCDSDGTPSGGGGTITNDGWEVLLAAVRALAADRGSSRS